MFADKAMRNKFVQAMTAENVPMASPSAATPLPPFPYIENKMRAAPGMADVQYASGPGNPLWRAVLPADHGHLQPRGHADHRAEIHRRAI